MKPYGRELARAGDRLREPARGDTDEEVAGVSSVPPWAQAQLVMPEVALDVQLGRENVVQIVVTCREHRAEPTGVDSSAHAERDDARTDPIE